MFILLYSRMLQLYTYTCRIHIDTMNKDERHSLLEKYIPLTLLKGFEKGYSRFYCERELETEQRLQHIDLPSPSGHRRVSFSFSCGAQPGAWGPSLSGTCSHSSIFSSTGLQTQSGVPRAPSAGWWLSLPHLVSNSSDLQLTDFVSPPSYIIVQSPTQSLEWHVWSSSSGNNCHAVHRSLSSGASVYECTMGIYLVPYFQLNPLTRFLLITAIGMCHFLPVHHFGMACLAGSKVNIQQFVLVNTASISTFFPGGIRICRLCLL